MGVVYKATDPYIGRTVALKTTHVDIHGAETGDLLKRFRNEARAAGVLSHRNIVTIYDAGEHDGVFYIAMELIEGTTLAGLLLQRKMLPPEQVVEVGTQIATGLDYAHSRGVVHRDVKPANIMIAPDGTVKIMDFGIANSGASLTHTGEVLGTPNYMSPEQVKGKPLDGRSDLFSTGVLLYEMLTGEKPFAGPTVATIIYKIVNEEPIPPRDLDVTIHPGLSAVITKALQKPPAERYQTGAELASELKHYREAGAATDATMALPVAQFTHEYPSETLEQPAVAPANAWDTHEAECGTPTAMSEPAISPPAVGDSGSLLMAERIATSELGIPSTPESESDEPPIAAAPRLRRSGLPVLWIVLTAALLVGIGVALRSTLHVSRNSGPVKQNVASTPVAPALPTAPQPQPPTPDQAAAAKDAPAAAQTVSAAASKPMPEPVTTGELLITSTPPGAQVEIDGRTIKNWVTPFHTPALKAGPHTVLLTLPGFEAVHQEVNVVAGKNTSVEMRLQQQQGRFSISSIPAGARILVDGRDTGLKTPSQVPVDAGQHKITLLKAGFHPAQTVAAAAGGQTFSFSTQLHSTSGPAPDTGYANVQPQANPFGRLRRLFGAGNSESQGAVAIWTYPKGATITVNNFQLRRTTPLRFPLEPGRYQITLKMDGYKTVTRAINVEKRKVVQIDEVLEPK